MAVAGPTIDRPLDPDCHMNTENTPNEPAPHLSAEPKFEHTPPALVPNVGEIFDAQTQTIRARLSRARAALRDAMPCRWFST